MNTLYLTVKSPWSNLEQQRAQVNWHWHRLSSIIIAIQSQYFNDDTPFLCFHFLL